MMGQGPCPSGSLLGILGASDGGSGELCYHPGRDNNNSYCLFMKHRQAITFRSSNNFRGGHSRHPHFTDEETEPKRGFIIRPPPPDYRAGI